MASTKNAAGHSPHPRAGTSPPSKACQSPQCLLGNLKRPAEHGHKSVDEDHCPLALSEPGAGLSRRTMAPILVELRRFYPFNSINLFNSVNHLAHSRLG